LHRLMTVAAARNTAATFIVLAEVEVSASYVWALSSFDRLSPIDDRGRRSEVI
jgi:hypothetical protein